MSFNDKPALCEVNLNFKEEPGDVSFFNVLIKVLRKMAHGTDTISVQKTGHKFLETSCSRNDILCFCSTLPPPQKTIKSNLPFPFFWQFIENKAAINRQSWFAGKVVLDMQLYFERTPLQIFVLNFSILSGELSIDSLWKAAFVCTRWPVRESSNSKTERN